MAQDVGVKSAHRRRLEAAQRYHRHRAPQDSFWPILLAIATGVAFIMGIFTPLAAPIAAVITFVALFGWFWPSLQQLFVAEPQK